jgi:hypothetical protein
MNIFDAVSIRIPCPVCNEQYEVPLSDLLLSNWMLNEGCPVCEETKCPPLFQTRLIGSEILSELAIAWNRLENNVRGNNGELVIRGTSQRMPGRKPRLTGNQETGNKRTQSKQIHSLAAQDSDLDPEARQRGLDETLKETFPCSDPLSCDPDPPLEETA